MTGPALRDIHLPPEPSWWPPAPGWWVLAALALLLIAWLSRWVLRHRRRRRRTRALLAEFERTLASAGDAGEELAALSSLLRRAARLRSPEAAALAGEAWLRFLDGDDPARPFSTGAGRLLHDALYRADAESDLASVRPLVRRRMIELAGAGDA